MKSERNKYTNKLFEEGIENIRQGISRFECVRQYIKELEEKVDLRNEVIKDIKKKNIELQAVVAYFKLDGYKNKK